jgi:hypothetical protein
MATKTVYDGLSLLDHCEAGDPKIVRTKHTTYVGDDWEIRCPCGFKKRYPWVQAYYAIRQWNEEMEKVTP